MVHLCVFIFICLGVFFSCTTPAADSTIPPNPIQIDATPIRAFNRLDATRAIFGALEFRGGLVLSSSDPEFGGISALYIHPDGEHFLALTDRAYWLQGRIEYEENHPAAIAGAEMEPVVGPGGRRAKNWDTESIAVSGDRLYLGVEDLDRIPYFSFVPRQFPVYRDAISFPPGKNLPRNRGLEALVFVPKKNPQGGFLVAFSEKGLDKNGNLIAFIVEDADQSEFAVKRSAGYDISDACLLPDGDILVLERKYEILNGVSMRLRRIPVSIIRPGVLADGPVLMEADMRNQVDNMEAIAVHRDVSGEIILTLMSDDNFSQLQRTLLLQFVLRK